MKNFIAFWYFVCEVINLLSASLLIFALFFNEANIITNKQIIFMVWLNISTHITNRTKHIQKEE